MPNEVQQRIEERLIRNRRLIFAEEGVGQEVGASRSTQHGATTSLGVLIAVSHHPDMSSWGTDPQPTNCPSAAQ